MASIISAGTTSGTSLNLSGDTSGVLQLATNGSTTAMTITTGQLVGIGTASPTHRLQVEGNSGAEVKVTRGTNSFVISLSNNIGGDVYVGTSVASALLLQTDNTERMRITSGGNVGIGTSSPASLLDVTGNDPTIRLTDNAGSPASTWSIRSTDGNFAIRDVTNSYDRATFNANGCMALTGANLTANGIGITFPATQSASSDANTLDDYEEGTWTPTDASGASLSLSILDARYTKIGRMVECFAQIGYPSTANGNAVSVGGLPFTSANTAGGAYGAFIGYTNHTTETTWLVSANATTSQAYKLDGTSLTNANISNKQFRLVWIYEV